MKNMEEQERLPYGAAAVVATVPVYVKDTLPARTIEIRDRYGILLATIRNVGSVALSSNKPPF